MSRFTGTGRHPNATARKTVRPRHTLPARSSTDPAEGYDRFKIRSATTLTRIRPLLTSRRHPPPGANVYTPDQYRVAQKKILTVVIKKDRLTWFGHVEHKTDEEWVKCCMTLEIDGARLGKEDILGRPCGSVYQELYGKLWHILRGCRE